MAKRLQVIPKDPEYREIQRVARSRRMSIAEWVRQALDMALRREPGAGVGKKLEVIRPAARHHFPSADIDRMLAEIESGYGINRILSFDSGFDGFPGITRLS
jgi:hypothetical protein